MIFGEIKNVDPINNWSDVPDGTRVIEDTYNELYELKREGGEFVLHHIGWRYANEAQKELHLKKPLNSPRTIDFEPDCMYDQPWYMEKQ